MLRTQWLALIALLVAALPTAVSAAPKRVAVLEFSGSEELVRDDERVYLADRTRGAALKSLDRGEWEVLTRENMVVVLQANADDLAACEGECEVETGRLIGAHVVVAGSLVMFGTSFRLTLKSFDTETGQLLTFEEVRGAGLDAIADGIPDACGKLFAPMAGDTAPRQATTVLGGGGDWHMDQDRKWVVPFETTPPGASVSVDGAYLCETPCSKALAEGTYSVTLMLPRYDEVERSLYVRKDAEVSEPLTPRFGWLSVTSLPSDLAVELDGEALGRTPVRDAEVTIGFHEVLFAEEGWFRDGATVSVRKGEARSVEIKARPLVGGLTVDARDSQDNDLALSLFVDGAGVGKTPWSGEIQVGEHQLQVGSWRETVAVREGQVERVVARIDSARGISAVDTARESTTSPPSVNDRFGSSIRDRQAQVEQGKSYAEQGDLVRAIQTFHTLIADSPDSSDNPEYQEDVIDWYWELERFEEAYREIDAMLEMCSPDSRWARANAYNTTTVVEAQDLIERTLRKAATDSFQQAMKRRSKELLQLAATAFEKYLDHFPDSHQAYEMRFRYGEALYKLKKFDLATYQYELVVQMDPSGKHLKDAATNTIFSIDKYTEGRKDEWDRFAKAQREAQTREIDPSRKYAPIELHEWEERLIAACDTYTRVLPDEENSSQVLYKAAFLLDTRNHFQEANRRYLEIVRARPHTETAQYAVHRMLSTYEAIEDWETLEQVAREFYDNPDVGKTATFKQELFVIYQNATIKIAEVRAMDAARTGSSAGFAAAAEAYLAFFDEFPQAKYAQLALYNAAFHYYRAGNKDRSLEIRHRFLDLYPDVPPDPDMAERQLYEKTLSVLVEYYRDHGDLDRAEQYARELVDRDPDFVADGFLSATYARLLLE